VLKTRASRGTARRCQARVRPGISAPSMSFSRTAIPPRAFLARLSGAQSWSISPKNFDGARGGGARAAEGTAAAALLPTCGKRA
jgi:hypothetical protein